MQTDAHDQLLALLLDSADREPRRLAAEAAPHPLSLRLGRDGLSALDEIARRRGGSRAEAARQAITETAERERRRSGLAAEARRLTQHKGYVREASRSAFGASFHPEVSIEDQPTQILCEMVGTVDARALGEQTGHLTHQELRAVEDALLLVLDLP